MSVLHEILDANEQYGNSFAIGDLPRPPARGVAILTCLDARIIPTQQLGLRPGDAAVIRNAGGRAADAVRSLVVATQLLGVREILVVHHTDCGLKAFSNEQIRARLSDNLGVDAAQAAQSVDFLAFEDLEESVREDVQLLHDSPLIPADVEIHGLIYDVQTGRLQHVASGS